jgi:ribonuclease P protein component
LIRKDRRLTKTGDFAILRRNGQSWSDNILVLRTRPNNLGVSRVGFSVSSRIGNAVIRNKVKRKLREAVRQSAVQEGWDLILIARKGAASAGFDALSSSVDDLLKCANLRTG